jgi:hypothetical protein
VAEFTERNKAVLEALRAPAEAIFALHGISVKRANGKGFLNVSRCPWCSHGEQGNPNWQCGVVETPGARGFTHGYKCFHPHDAQGGDDTPAYADVLVALGHISEEEARWAKSLRQTLEIQRQTRAVRNAASSISTGSARVREFAHRRLQSHVQAKDWLEKTRGFSPYVAEHFMLGLSEAYTPRGESEPLHADALAAPLKGRDGKFYGKYVNYAIPGVTQDRRDKKLKSWSAGAARTYYSDKAEGKKRLFICDGLKDLWAVWDKIRGTPLEAELLLISSTNGGGGQPEEWKEASFWEEWETIYLGHDNDAADPKTGRKAGDEHAKAIARLAMREMRRVWPVGVKDWNDFFLSGKTLEDFEQLLTGAYPLGLKELGELTTTGDGIGLQAAAPVAISGAFHNGHLYEAVDVLERVLDSETNEVVERYRTVVVRSDGTMHAVRTMPAPKGTPTHQHVHRLVPDGTIVDGPARPSPYCTWRWPSIQSFIEGKSREKPLAEQLERIRRHLKASVWLPYEDDYALLTCTVAATYVQALFDAVPLILVTGAPGTGKTQLGIAMSEISANSPSSAIGQISAASIARLIDQSRGFVVLDDLESVGTRRNGDAQFDELIQALKLSYNKQSAVKYWTNMKTNRLEKLNFFGIKLINNTRGVDAILGSRMFTIATKKMPEGNSLSTAGLLSPEERTELRDGMHTWAFRNAAQVAQAYGAVFPNKTTRSDEIAAPLKVISLLGGDRALTQSLERAIERQGKIDVQPETPEQVLHEALEDILLQSVAQDGLLRTVVTVTEVIMRMALLVDTNYGKGFVTELSDIESPEWVGRQLKQKYVKTGGEQQRLQLYGKYLRGYELADEFINRTIAKGMKETPDLFAKPLKRSVDARDFCRGCGACDYRNRCEIRLAREAKEGTSAERDPSQTAH